MTECVGRQIHEENFHSLFRKNGSNFVCYVTDRADEAEFADIFRITERQRRLWYFGGVTVSIYAYISDDHITKINVLKYREGCGGHGRQQLHELRLTLQEQRIIRRILDSATAQGAVN